VARKREGQALPRAPITRLLSRALDAGLWRRGHRLGFAGTLPPTIERGTEALRAVNGLVAVRAFEPAREILRGYVEYLNEGLAPESFQADGTPVYGDAEPSLWLVIAGERYVRRSGNEDFARGTLYPALEEVMRYYRSGAPGGIRVDEDGLLVTHRLDAEGVPQPVKRAGLNALWSHAYIAMSQLARVAGRRETAAFYLAWAQDHQKRFLEILWDAQRGALLDRIEDGTPVAGVCADHVWAVGLGPALLPADRATSVIGAIERELAGRFGLREKPEDPEIRSAWLGPWCSARVRTAARSEASLQETRTQLETVCEWMDSEGSGGLPAVWSPDGAPLGAAGVSPLAAAELLRFWVEDCEHVATGVAGDV
jgi:predicted glycogen debranching enzyme